VSSRIAQVGEHARPALHWKGEKGRTERQTTLSHSGGGRIKVKTMSGNAEDEQAIRGSRRSDYRAGGRGKKLKRLLIEGVRSQRTIWSKLRYPQITPLKFQEARILEGVFFFIQGQRPKAETGNTGKQEFHDISNGKEEKKKSNNTREAEKIHINNFLEGRAPEREMRKLNSRPSWARGYREGKKIQSSGTHQQFPRGASSLKASGICKKEGV